MPTESEHYDLAKPVGTDGVTRAAYNLLIDAIDAAIWSVQVALTGHAGAGGAVHAVATTLAAGFMSAADKLKVDGLDTSYAPLAHVGAGGAAHQAATTGLAGFMSAADKLAVNAIGAHVGVGGATHPAATASVAGFMAALDKLNLTSLITGYDLRIQMGTATHASWNLGSAQNYAIGFSSAPRGGIHTVIPRRATALVNLRMVVLNTLGTSQSLTWRFPRFCREGLHIYVDTTKVTSGALNGNDQTFAYTMTTGLHTVEFRLAITTADPDVEGQLYIADWLTSTIICQPGDSAYF